MSVSGIGGSNNAATSLYSSVGQVAGQSTDSGSSAVNAAGGLGSGSQGGQLTAALMQALAQLGISPATSGSASTGTGSTTQDRITSLIQSLAAALQSQTAGNSANPATTNPASAVAATSSSQSTLEVGLKNLILQINSADSAMLGSMFGSSDSTNSSDATMFGGSADSSTSSASTLSSLQQNFQSLMASQGTSSKQSTTPTLQSFLQSTLQNFQGANSIGNLISTQA